MRAEIFHLIQLKIIRETLIVRCAVTGNNGNEHNKLKHQLCLKVG